jgi:sigma-E factor negative regulatory protein RseC
MRDKGSVEHKGVVEEVNDNLVRVGFVAHSACSGCHARGVCSLSEVENKFVEVRDDDNSYKTGDRVDILLQKSQGFRALWLGYILPFILMVAVLLIAVAITGREGLAGLLSVGVLVPYYLGLYILRERVKQKFEFKIRKTV